MPLSYLSSPFLKKLISAQFPLVEQSRKQKSLQ